MIARKNKGLVFGRGARSLSAAGTLNMTPMVDVVMVILIFFMAATSAFGPEALLRSAVAADGGGADVAGAGVFALPELGLDVQLASDDDGVWFTGLGVERAPIDALADVAARVAGELAGDVPSVTVTPGDGVSYEDAVRAHAALHAAGFERVALR